MSAPISFNPFLEQITLVGVSYRTAGLDVRSQLSFTGQRLAALRGRLVDSGANGLFVLSTCNRTELYFSGIGHGAAIQVLAEVSGLTIAQLESHLYVMSGSDAARHLFRVGCGLESAALGETEILAQVRASWREAVESKTMGGALDVLCRRAIRVGKRARAETELCRHVTSVASMAVRQAGPLAGKDVLLVGAGAIAERLAKEISLVGVGRCVVANRTESRAEALATRYRFESASLLDLAALVGRADVVFAAVSCDRPLITGSMFGGRTADVVDLGVPAAVESVPSHVRLVDMETLASLCQENAKVRASALAEVEEIVDQELQDFLAECGERTAAPAIRRLVEQGERVRQAHVEWALANLEGLSPSQRKVVEDLAFRIVRGVLQGPIQALKSSSLLPGERAALGYALQGEGD